MDKLDGKTFDVVKDNIEKMKELFPDIFTEGKIDMDKFMLTLGEHVEKDKERYEFTWNGKTEAIQLAQKQTTGTLRPCKDESVNWDSTQNIYIEGDNLEVLRTLQSSYRNKVKMIYIDPPYNTGKDFLYTDDFHNNIKSYKNKLKENMKSNAETNGRYHTDWLNMIYPRLKLARNLLNEEGVVFISIDDNELPNLIKVCDEVYGEDNFIGIFTVNSTPNARDYGHIGKMHEYIIFYAKSISDASTNLLIDKDKKFTYKDNISGFNIHPLYNSNEAFNKDNRPNLYYPFYVNPNNCLKDNFYEISLEKRDGYIRIDPPLSRKNNVQFVWRWGKQKSLENLNKEIVAYKLDDEYRIVQKMRHSEKLIRSLLLEKTFSSRRGTAEVEELFGNKIFTFPKPIELIKQLITVGTNKDSLVLDIFSGSATTAHSLFEKNAEDQGNRKFIMIQLPESTGDKTEAFKAGYKNIADIGKERIRRAGIKVSQEIKEKNNNYSLDSGFKVFKLDETNLQTWDEESINLEKDLMDMIDPVKEGRTQEDVVYEVLLKYGVDLTVPIEQKYIAGKSVYDVGMGYLLICLERDLTLDFIKHIAELKPARVVFYDEGFKDDTVRTNAQQILKRHNVEDIRVI